MKVGDLPFGVNPGIRPTRPDEGDRLSGQTGNCRFDLSLNTDLVFLALPAVVGTAVVFDQKFEIFSGFRKPTILAEASSWARFLY